MKWEAKIAHPKPMYFLIEREILKDTSGIGEEAFRLYAYGDEESSYDDLQDTLEWAMEVAREESGVPLDAWRRVE
ncbi:MAG: hypothetical protein H6908_06460 [Hyphomicrobiales bacterium]|nr:hypothetical protein [Hyphomicrobiales bacterium]